ncbi:hypothetical protein BDN70DRAFT_899425 [Pholiota conissans]|uniref:Uncharacterized protein n=1 Tax=Pholiota conissans TaxID=109636 RepID=A0A9P5YQ75_9AGAR|nr:hypothetical protein BDN70DRAFT_899425 [Pholiota conissans]
MSSPDAPAYADASPTSPNTMPTTLERTTTTTTTNSNNTASGNEDAFVIGNNTVNGDAPIINAMAAGNVVFNVNVGRIESTNNQATTSTAPVFPQSSSSSPSPSHPPTSTIMHGVRRGIPSTRHLSISSIQEDSTEEDIIPEGSIREGGISIVYYMSSSMLFNSTTAIPLWRPSPSLDDTRDVGYWSRNVYIGDVGIFDENGGFNTYFNIFESKGENLRRRYTPPSNFVPFYKKLSEIHLDSEAHRLLGKRQIMLTGFLSNLKEMSETVKIMFPPNTSSHQNYAAIHMQEGYTRINLFRQETEEVLAYCRNNQTAWYDSLENSLNGQSLVIITTSYRVRAWASAVAKFTKKGSTAKLIQQSIEGEEPSFWSADDAEILTKSGPSRDYISKTQAYLQKFPDIPNRKEIEECYVVAVDGYCLQDKTAWNPLGTIGAGSKYELLKTGEDKASDIQRFLAQALHEESG